MSYNGRSFKKHAPQHASQAARHANAMIKHGADPKARCEARRQGRAPGERAVHEPMREGYNKIDESQS
jgi:hypothetical protein